MNTKSKSGFTLIELLVVIAIIGLLSTLSIVALNNARARARDARRVADIKQIQTALELYYNDKGEYPASASVVSGGKIANGTAIFMNSIPTAPTPIDTTTCTSHNTYTYASVSPFSTYTLKYCLGADTADISAGIHTATPAGIK